MRMMIFGCGYLGRRVAEIWSRAGREVHVVTRSGERAAEFARAGWRPIVADVTRPASLAPLPAVDTVLFAVGHDRAGSASIEDVYVRGLATALDALPAGVERFVHVSSTGVYGQTDASLVDEDSPCRPERPGGKASLAAEQLLAASRFGSRAIVLRMAGLYGPGRIPRQRELLSATPLPTPVEGWLNLIHVDDAAMVAAVAAERAAAPRIYIVSDGHPVARREYYEEAARLLGAPAPSFVVPSDDSPAAERARADKRLDNRRMLRELEVRLRFQSYREGLAASLAAERAGSAKEPR